MSDLSVLVALLLGVAQGLLEWLPVSSEGQIALVLVVLTDLDAGDAVSLGLFLHAGTAIAAVLYYRRRVATLLREAWPPRRAAASDELRFYLVGTVVSVVVAGAAYVALMDLASALSGAAFVAVIGALLIVTGLLPRRAEGGRRDPTEGDAVLVGVLQGLAILPGVSRSGVTVGALLLRNHDPTAAFRLSFLLGVPASLGAGVLAVGDHGVASLRPAAAAAALLASAVVGYLAVGALVAVAQRVDFRGVCLALGALALVGGLLAL